MQNYTSSELSKLLTLNKNKVVLFGAGDLGELSLISLHKLGIKVDFFCDNKKEKQGSKFLDVDIISPENLKEIDQDANIFITNNYISLVNSQLEKDGFKKIYNCFELVKNTDFSDIKNIQTIHPGKIERRIEYYRNLCFHNEYASSGTLNIRSLDVQITERCSLRCTNCANLMQYYERPENSDLNQMFEALDRFMACVNSVAEFRVLGGDPFMNKDLHLVVDKLKEYDQVKKIAVYTNAKIIPKGPNLECLKHNRVTVDITNYGSLSNKHEEIVKVLKDNKVAYSTLLTTTWQDSGSILPFQKRTHEENKKVFMGCCNRDVISLLHGKLYRCPFSANADNLKAIPEDKTDYVDLCDKNIPIGELKDKIKELSFNKEFLTACTYCNGRDYTVSDIKAAEQSKKPRSYKVF